MLVATVAAADVDVRYKKEHPEKHRGEFYEDDDKLVRLSSFC